MLWMPCPSLSPCFCRDLWHLCLKVHATFPKVPPTFTDSCQTKLTEAKFCQDFEAKVCSRFWSWILLKIVGEIACANSLSVPLRNLILYATLCLNVLHFLYSWEKMFQPQSWFQLGSCKTSKTLCQGGCSSFVFFQNTNLLLLIHQTSLFPKSKENICEVSILRKKELIDIYWESWIVSENVQRREDSRDKDQPHGIRRSFQ